jgi:hypothetical protein
VLQAVTGLRSRVLGAPDRTRLYCSASLARRRAHSRRRLYLAVRLKAGECWRYAPPAGHTVCWVALMGVGRCAGRGRPGCGTGAAHQPYGGRGPAGPRARLRSADQRGQFLAGIEHACFHGRCRHVQNLRGLFNRFLVIVDEIDHLPVLGGQLGQGLAQGLIQGFFLKRCFRIIRRAVTVASMCSSSSASVRRRRAERAL